MTLLGLGLGLVLDLSVDLSVSFGFSFGLSLGLILALGAAVVAVSWVLLLGGGSFLVLESGLEDLVFVLDLSGPSLHIY